MPSWVQDPKTGKLIPKDQYRPPTTDAPYVQGDIEDFVSPITREVINDRAKLREHNRVHGVTDSRDYSNEFLKQRQTERMQRGLGKTQEDKQDRINRIKAIMDKRGL